MTFFYAATSQARASCPMQKKHQNSFYWLFMNNSHLKLMPICSFFFFCISMYALNLSSDILFMKHASNYSAWTI